MNISPPPVYRRRLAKWIRRCAIVLVQRQNRLYSIP